MSGAVEPEHVLEIFLQPGEYYWGDYRTRIRTLLGSCISVCLWHPRLHMGGMSHFLLPERPVPQKDGREGQYGREVIELFLEEIEKSATKPPEYEVKIFGGSSMLPSPQPLEGVGMRNVRMAESLLTRNGFLIHTRDLGGNHYRKIIFELWSGTVWMKKQYDELQ